MAAPCPRVLAQEARLRGHHPNPGTPAKAPARAQGAALSRPPHVIVCDDARAWSERAAEIIHAGLAETLALGKPRASLGLCGGKTPRPLYELLGREPFLSRLPWPRLDFFWGDERCVPPQDPESNYRLAMATLLSKVPVLAARVHRMRGELSPARAATEYEALLKRRAPKGLDLLLLGLGEDGHTASLFPGSPALEESSRWVAAAPSGSGRPRLTLTLPFINRSERILVLARGPGKAGIVRRAFSAPPQTGGGLPIQGLRAEPPPLWILDRPAAAFLDGPRRKSV